MIETIISEYCYVIQTEGGQYVFKKYASGPNDFDLDDPMVSGKGSSLVLGSIQFFEGNLFEITVK